MKNFILLKTKIINFILKNKKIILPLCLFLIFIPFFTDALIGTGIFDFFTAKLAGISEITSPWFAFFVFILVALIFSFVGLHIVAWLLETSMNPMNLEIAGSELVQVGWQFISSLANIAIIIALIIIGISTILNQESYNAKKTLPRLIIVALLVNFSLVFVGMIVDISHVVLNTFTGPNGSVVNDILDAIFTSGSMLLIHMGAYLLTLMIGLIIPFTAAIVQYGLVFAMTTFFLPTIISAILQIITSSVLIMVLFTYAFLFYARIFVIQILAIISPLAFIAWALPTTKHYWQKWLDALIGWSFLGVILSFFLLLSSIAVAPFRPDAQAGVPSINIINSVVSAPTIFYYYFVLIIFLIITVYISKKSMPAAANAIISSAQGFAQTAMKYTAPMTSVAVNRVKASAAQKTTAQSIENQQKRLDAQKANFQDATGFAKFKEGLSITAGTVGGYASRATRKAGIYTGSAPEAQIRNAQKHNAHVYEDLSAEELERIVTSPNAPMYRRQQSFEKLIDKKGGKTDLKKLISYHDDSLISPEKKGVRTENDIQTIFSNISETSQKKLRAARPDVDAFVGENAQTKRSLERKLSNLEQGTTDYNNTKTQLEEVNQAITEKIKENISKMRPSDLKGLKLDSFAPEYSNLIAEGIMQQSSSILEDYSESDQKKIFSSLDGLNEESSNQSINKMHKTVLPKYIASFKNIEDISEDAEEKEKTVRRIGAAFKSYNSRRNSFSDSEQKNIESIFKSKGVTIINPNSENEESERD